MAADAVVEHFDVLEDFTLRFFARRAMALAASPGSTLNFNPNGPNSLLIPTPVCPKGSDDIQLTFALCLPYTANAMVR